MEKIYTEEFQRQDKKKQKKKTRQTPILKSNKLFVCLSVSVYFVIKAKGQTKEINWCKKAIEKICFHPEQLWIDR